MKLKIIQIILIFQFIVYWTFAQESVVLKSARAELNRTMTELKSQPRPPYFISYSINDVHTVRITSSFGKLLTIDSNRRRTLDIDLRVGDYQLDNTHIIRGASFSFGSSRSSVDLPLEDDELAIRSAIWSGTDRSYKKAIETYEKVLANKAVKVQEEDTSADFSREKPQKYIGEEIKLKLNTSEWIDRLNRISSLFSANGWIYSGMVSLNVEVTTKYFVSSEGGLLQYSEPSYRIFISGRTKADDGMNLPLYKSYFSFSADGLPKEETLINDTKKMIDVLGKLRTAPLMQTFSGPAILSGEASGVFFHEIFGHRVEGHRQKDPNSSQTFKGFENKSILPDFIDVLFDPTINKLRGIELSGYYLYDDQGVKAEKVVSVENGIFKNFIMSRSPIENFPRSNGHGRKQAGYSAVSRQSNLIVDAKKTVPVNELRNMLIEECKKQDKEFGLYFEKVQGGFTFTGRTIPNAFNVQPILVYKIYVDGRPDELVRGVDLIGTPLTTFSKIIAAGDDIGVFNGICGAESGGVPVSACSPSLLVSMIEVQKKTKSQAKPPLLPSP
ncbi:MAG: metallopeptidase TldD-related protein [Candidatus Kapabacteria bacterium]|nr:metallopeptidase TldD-related protein [Candidatus Kapabacteria bacterium]